MARVFLALNGKRINTLDDLRANFNGKQVLDFYRAGRLQKWLGDLGDNDLLETMQDFQNENYDDETLLSMLMAAFELDERQIAEARLSIGQKKAEPTEAQSPGAALSPGDDSETCGEPADLGEEVVAPCWYCDGEGVIGGFTESTCPHCHGKKEAPLPQWLKTLRDDKVSNEEKLRCLAQEVLKVIQDAVVSSDDLPARVRNREICLYAEYKEQGLSRQYNQLFFKELSQTLKLHFGDDISHWDWASPYGSLLEIAAKYLPDTITVEFDRSEFRVRYSEMLYSEFGD